MSRGLALLATLALACGPRASQPPTPPAPAGLRLVESDGAWFVTGMHPDAAGLVAQGDLFAALRPIAGTPDARAVAVLKALGPAVGASVPVAPQCVAPGAALASPMPARPLSAHADERVGPCLARVIATGTSERGEAYVVLNVGAGAGLVPGDQFLLLGAAVVADGAAPLALDTDRDGLCQVPADPLHLKAATARCVVVRRPPDRADLRGGAAAWMPRDGS
ncbi:MAG: hypothetical protein JNL82_06800 [Myxococcales bacterium]|nr:hypothetical protein [Myxococcales bacterium]